MLDGIGQRREMQVMHGDPTITQVVNIKCCLLQQLPNSKNLKNEMRNIALKQVEQVRQHLVFLF